MTKVDNSSINVFEIIQGCMLELSVLVGAPNLKKGLQGRIWKLSPLSGLYQFGNNI